MDPPFVLSSHENRGILSLLSAIEQSGDSFSQYKGADSFSQDSVFQAIEGERFPPDPGVGLTGELCLVCGTQDQGASAMVDVFLEELGGRRLYCKIEEIVARRVVVRNSSLVCQDCFSLLRQIQDLESQLVEMKRTVTTKFALSNPLKKKTELNQKSPRKKAEVSSLSSMYEPLDFSEPVVDMRMPLQFLAETSSLEKEKVKSQLSSDKGREAIAVDDGFLEVRDFSCSHCAKTFKTQGLLLKHQKVHQSIIFQCSDCDQKFSSKRALADHHKVHQDDTLYSCDYCHKDIRGQKSLRAHITSKHMQDKKFLCSHCPEIFASRHLKNVHERDHNGEKASICDQCGESFATAQSLSHHKSKHTGDYPYKCDFCQKGFNNYKLMEEHRHIHSGKKPYQCKVCSKGFANRGSLWLHMKQHETKKPYACGDCNKSFTHSSHLAVHKRIHSGEKPYKCRICGEGFISSNHLKRHMKIHANLPAFACGHCKETFDQRRQLVAHSNEVHAGNVIEDQGAIPENGQEEGSSYNLVLEGSGLVNLGEADDASDLVQMEGQGIEGQHRLVDLINEDGVSLGQTIVLIQMQGDQNSTEGKKELLG